MMIETYSFGVIKIDGREYRSDLVVYPDHVDDKWWRQEGHLLQLEDLSGVLALTPEVLIVGQGLPGLMKVDGKVEEYCRQNNVRLEVMPTGQAVEAYNLSRKTNKTVIACIHLTC